MTGAQDVAAGPVTVGGWDLIEGIIKADEKENVSRHGPYSAEGLEGWSGWPVAAGHFLLEVVPCESCGPGLIAPLAAAVGVGGVDGDGFRGLQQTSTPELPHGFPNSCS